MKITWYGQACFRLEGESNGKRLSIVTDPYTPEKAGYPPVPQPADVVVTSSVTDDFHDREDLVPGEHVHVNALEVADNGGLFDLVNLGFPVGIEAVEAAEADLHPSGHPDRNALYAFRLDGMRVAHMGDVGNPLSKRQTDFLRDTDVLLALAGGFPTIPLPELMKVIEEVRPRLVIPMHFRTLSYRPRNIAWLPAFLRLFGEERTDFACAATAEITRESLPDETRMLVIDYVRPA